MLLTNTLENSRGNNYRGSPFWYQVVTATMTLFSFHTQPIQDKVFCKFAFSVLPPFVSYWFCKVALAREVALLVVPLFLSLQHGQGIAPQHSLLGAHGASIERKKEKDRNKVVCPWNCGGSPRLAQSLFCFRVTSGFSESGNPVAMVELPDGQENVRCGKCYVTCSDIFLPNIQTLG